MAAEQGLSGERGLRMYDPTIHPKTLRRQLRAADFYDDPQLIDSVHRNAVIAQAVSYGCQGFPTTSLKRSALRGKSIYGFTDLAEALVIRHITRNIRRVTSVKQDDRAFIVRCIHTLLSEGVSYRVYKFDVASFYESVDVRLILERLSQDIAFSGQSVRSLTSFFSRLGAAGITGLPRGLAVSATLAEYLMRGFDRHVASVPGVWYYARFVDDILIITDNREDPAAFRQLVAAALPQGLQFNDKSKDLPLSPFKKGNAPTPEAAFDFLGYRFEVSHAYRDSANKIVRQVRVDLALSKINKLKTRIAKSLLRYIVDQNFIDLRDRIRMLSSNVIYIDWGTGVRRPSGIRFNYPLLNHSTSTALRELDRFVRTAVFSPHPKNALRAPSLTQAQRRELAGLTFLDGFASTRFFHIRTERLMDLSAIWSYV
jgi:hypothetical protein